MTTSSKRKPSEEKKWLKHYSEGAEEKSRVPEGVTVLDYIEERFKKHQTDLAISYRPQGQKYKFDISRPTFIQRGKEAAKALDAFGVKNGSNVPLFGVWTPEMIDIMQGNIRVGALSNFLKLSASSAEKDYFTEDAEFAVVFDGLYEGIKDVVDSSRFKNVVVISPLDSLNIAKPVKWLLKKQNERYAFQKGMGIKFGSKFIDFNTFIKEARRRDDVKILFEKHRPIYVTYSSGSTSKYAKGAVATNESQLSQIKQHENADLNFVPGDVYYNNLPGAASTSVSSLLWVPLNLDMSVTIDPVIDEEKSFERILINKPNNWVMTGSFTERMYEQNAAMTKKPDLSFMKNPVIGGEGTSVRKFREMNETARNQGFSYTIPVGGGLSEFLSCLFMSKINIEKTDHTEQTVCTVGIPLPGTNISIRDENGNELGYNQRGEIWAKSESMMKEYYKDEHATEKFIHEGWGKCGDLGSIDEDGLVYIYGRTIDVIENQNGEKEYLFDIANSILQFESVKSCLVTKVYIVDEDKYVPTVHISFEDDYKETCIEELYKIDASIRQTVSPDFMPAGYMIKEKIAVDKTTAKKARVPLGSGEELIGLVKPTDDGIYRLDFINAKNGRADSRKYKSIPDEHVAEISTNKLLVKSRKF